MKRDGLARQDKMNTSRQLTNTTLTQTSERDTDRFSLDNIITRSLKVTQGHSRSFKVIQGHSRSYKEERRSGKTGQYEHQETVDKHDLDTDF